MKCQKCNYISFDYNQACPKCNRDLSGEQEKLNLPAFKPSPLSLLGTLTGDVSESHADLHPEDMEGTMQLQRDLGLSPENLVAEEPEPLGDIESEDLELRLDAEAPEELGQTVSIDRAAAEPGAPTQADVPLEETLLDLKADEEELLLDSDEISPEDLSAEPPFAEKVGAEDEITLDLSELETEVEPGTPKEPPFFGALSPADLKEIPGEGLIVDKPGPAESAKNMDEAEMVTMEIEKAKEGIERELEELDLEMELDESSDKNS